MEETTGSQMSQWCRREFCEINFGDERLNQRFLQTADYLSRLPTAPINQACRTAAAVKGSYRLFANEKCERDEILKVHVDRTLERIGAYERIFIIQDTTFFEFGGHKETEGLGPIAAKSRKHLQGLLAHTALAVGSDGVSLGLLDQKIWARDNPQFAHVWKEEKESSKWLKLLEHTHAILPKGVQAITIADREADITALMKQACELEVPFIIRSRDRKLAERTSEHGSSWLIEHLEHQPVVFEYTIEVPIKTRKKAAKRSGMRVAQVEVHFGAVSIRDGAKKSGQYKYHQHKIPQSAQPPEQGLELFAVLVMEKRQQEDASLEPVNWVLLTNLKIKTAEQAMECVSAYKMRWHIENFHRVLKSGCTVEQCRLQTAEKLDRYITLMSIIAWRLYWLTHLSRAKPDALCEQIFEPREWKLLHRYHNPSAPTPNEPPSLREVTHWIARLGGFLGRKGDGEPGVITLWRGYQRFIDMIFAYEILHESRGAATCG